MAGRRVIDEMGVSANSFRLVIVAMVVAFGLSLAGRFFYGIVAGHNRIERCVASGFANEPDTREACERAERQGRL